MKTFELLLFYNITKAYEQRLISQELIIFRKSMIINKESLNTKEEIDAQSWNRWTP
ncbi:hypothetical protein CWATWH8502_3574 [Crocosphaera watsonii WH 8502]|uniref:Uncharacterized protein n=3 Tax=Crocosphaera watsonii TaxID=263511 RepID=T2JVK5_CROWT|nr:hypothetical protein CWATWH8502_3574 [Crocosphaera watsonii WH 8502]CCQ54308.1 hypothetical protein CWATWH0005_5023 [Crocosphaera watsonii WH 0005]CCQ69250.1 hypothetical protein CWATWH0402_5421 [Crocosphaera watsonii WH 0402]